jgi:hypothetical protein
MFTKAEAFLKGKKTYITAFLMVVVAAMDVITGDMAISDFLADGNVELLLTGFAVASLRAGMKK